MEYDFSKIELTPHQLKMLKQLKQHGAQDPGLLDISDLFESKLVQPSVRCKADRRVKELVISKKGRLYLQWRWEDMFRHRWPVYLSIAAFVVSGASLLLSILA